MKSLLLGATAALAFSNAAVAEPEALRSMWSLTITAPYWQAASATCLAATVTGAGTTASRARCRQLPVLMAKRVRTSAA